MVNERAALAELTAVKVAAAPDVLGWAFARTTGHARKDVSNKIYFIFQVAVFVFPLQMTSNGSGGITDTEEPGQTKSDNNSAF